METKNTPTPKDIFQQAADTAAELQQKYAAIDPVAVIDYWVIPMEENRMQPIYFKKPSRMLKMIFFDQMQSGRNSLAAQDFLKAIILPENTANVLDAIEPDGKPENDTLAMTLIMKANTMVNLYAAELKKK
jgi:hypothetical protein